MKIVYISENKMYKCENGKITELPSERADHYADTVQQIAQNKEWKHSGTGAHFMGTVRPSASTVNASVQINGIAAGGPGLIYSIIMGEMGGIYGKIIDNPDAAEEHIYTSMNMDIGSLSIKEEKIALCSRGHLSVADLNGNIDDVTGGDSMESDPSWSETDGRIFCTTAGVARDPNGSTIAFSPRSIMAIDISGGTMEELYSDEKYDFMKPKNDVQGNFYYIRQPHKEPQEKDPLWKDILLFPLRIVKALIGFLNAFSVLFGGESLRSGKQNGDVKTKQKSEKEMYFEGKLLEAEKNEKENMSKGEKNPGILPVNRVLVRIGADGSETVIKRGVLDYSLLKDGSILCSNGRNIVHVSDEGEEVIAKAHLAHDICVIEEV